MSPESSAKRFRLQEIDILRGIAILMMVVFHFMWSLWYWGLVGVSLYTGFWGVFQKLTGGLFIFLVGLSLTLSYSRTIKKNPEKYPVKYIKRGLKVFGYGLIITVASLVFFPKAFVFFGILHFIGVSIILVTPFIRFKWANLVLGLMALVGGIYLKRLTFSFPWLVWLGFMHPVTSLDLYTVLPWIGIVFFGLFAGNMLYPGGELVFKLKRGKSFLKSSSSLRWLGRNSLLIYFLHLPIVYGAAYLVSLF